MQVKIKIRITNPRIHKYLMDNFKTYRTQNILRQLGKLGIVNNNLFRMK